MAYIQELLQLSNNQQQQYLASNREYLGLPEGTAYSSFYPQWETITPQYQTPNPYQLAQMGYRTNELVFTCINVRADSISEAPLKVYKDGEEVEEHGLTTVLANPCPGISEQTFWKIVEIYLGIAGFSCWEKERNNLGEVIRLWPMRPDWCSFLRGQQKPIRAVRYQPYGLPWFDIDVEDLLFFQYFDPLYPLLKPFSPTMSALEMINTDNNMTIMIQNFLKNGNFLGGLLSTENQVLQEAEAEVYKRRWQQSHGGAGKAGEIAVIGKGLKFQTTSSSFKDMVFPEVDARSESRITMVFRVPPILIGAKVGIDRSTFANYEESRKSFYEGPISNQWKFLAGVVLDQMLGDFESDISSFECAFDTGGVKALQEDRNAQVDRADKMFKGRWATMNEARAEAHLDPVEDEELGKSFYEAVSIKPQEQVNEEGEVVEGQADQKQLPAPEEKQPTDEEEEAQASEEKKARSFIKRRIKEKHYDDIYHYEFKFLSEEKQKKLLKEFEAQIVIEQLRDAVKEEA